MENSLLARLPGELRTAIYEYALLYSDAVPLSCKRCSNSTAHQLRKHLRPLHALLALTQTCAQIRKECGRIFFTENTFVFCHRFTNYLERSIDMVLTRLPTVWTSKLRSVEFQLEPSICFCRGCNHATDVLRRKLLYLFQAIYLWCEEFPQCSFVFRSALCYDPAGTFELHFGDGGKSWQSVIEYAGLSRHWHDHVDTEVETLRRDVMRRTQKVFGYLWERVRVEGDGQDL